MQLTIVQRRRERGAVLAVAVSLLGLTGCMSSLEPRSVTAPSRGLGLSARRDAHSHEGHDPATCVMQVPGTGIQVRDIDGGVAVTFDTVASDRVPDLRRAVDALMQAYEQGRRSAGPHRHSPRALELARRYRELAGDLPPLSAVVNEVEGGAELVVLATSPATVALLRQKMRSEVAVMQRGVCPLAAD
jgi:hypothetical protein